MDPSALKEGASHSPLAEHHEGSDGSSSKNHHEETTRISPNVATTDSFARIDEKKVLRKVCDLYRLDYFLPAARFHDLLKSNPDANRPP